MAPGCISTRSSSSIGSSDGLLRNPTNVLARERFRFAFVGAGQTHPHQRSNTILHDNAQQASTRAGESAILQTNRALFAGAIALVIVSPVLAYDFGRPATPDTIALWDRCPAEWQAIAAGQ